MRPTLLPVLLSLALTLGACADAGSPTPTSIPPGLTPPPAAPSSTPAPDTATPAPSATPLPSPTPMPTETLPPPTASSVDPGSYALKSIATGLTRPLFLTHAGDGSGRLFVVTQPGQIFVVKDGGLLPDPFLDITNIVNDNAFERGLLGLAFHPRYADNGLFFVNYTDGSGNTVVARFNVSDDPDRADPSSRHIILQVDQPFPNHNGGDIAFGRDGYLYIGMGDGGSGGDPQGNAQNLGRLLGKMLRIDVEGDVYAVPPDNPFVADGRVLPEIWAYGLRNPWRFSFDRATGDLYVADVGQQRYEEVNFQPAASGGGENYGWDFMEGLHPFEGQAPGGLIPPVAEYAQAEGGCSVTGGYVYRGTELPALNGVYLFGDYCSGRIWSLARTAEGDWRQADFMSTGFNISSFGEDEQGEVYVVDHGGAVYQLVASDG